MTDIAKNRKDMLLKEQSKIANKLGRMDARGHLDEELLLLTKPKPKVKNPKKRIKELRTKIAERESKLEAMYKRLCDIRVQLVRLREEEPPQILIVLGENRSGKTRLLHLLKDWLGYEAGYYPGKLPEKAREDILFLDNQTDEKNAGQIENLARGRKVILTLTDAHRFKFSPKARINILKINGLETVGAEPKD